MNLGLIDPFESDYPEKIEEYLEHKVTKCIAFNRRGTLLAAGCIDGTVVIWDFITRGVAKELTNPDSGLPITSVSWSKCGSRLLSADTERTLTLWNVVPGERIASKTLKHAALYARLHPKDPSCCLVCPVSSAPLLVDFMTGNCHALPLSVSALGTESKQTSRGKQGDFGGYASSAASFNRTGQLIYVGNSKGEILIVDTETRVVLAAVETPGCQVIKQIVFSRNGQYMLTNASDRTIRVFKNLLAPETAAPTIQNWSSTSDSTTDAEVLLSRGSQCLEFTRSFRDSINPVHWKAACFSGDGEMVVGASANKGEHKIHIWNRQFGQLTRVLDGPKEGLTDLSWHPTRPIVASVTMRGLVYVWARDYTESWSAFAPDFKELHENEEYVEREDEFDMKLPESEEANNQKEADDEEIDILTNERVAAYSDSDVSECGLYYLPTIPQCDVPAEEALKQPTSPKPHGRSPSDSGGSPCAGALHKPKEAADTEVGAPADMEVEEPEPSSPHLGDSPMDEEVGPNGRTKRKRKIPEKAAEFQAEMGRKSQKKINSVPTPRPKMDVKATTPAAAGKDVLDEDEAEDSRKSQKQTHLSTPSAKANPKTSSLSLGKAQSSDTDDDDDSAFQNRARKLPKKSISEATPRLGSSSKVNALSKANTSKAGGGSRPASASRTPDVQRNPGDHKTGVAPKSAGPLRPPDSKRPGGVTKASGAERPGAVRKSLGSSKPGDPVKALGAQTDSLKAGGGQKGGSAQKAGGSQKAGGAVKPGNGSIHKAGGAVKLGNGNVQKAGGTMKLGNGNVQKAGGAVKPGNGNVQNPEGGAVKLGNGNAEKPGGAMKPGNGNVQKGGGALKPGTVQKSASAQKPSSAQRPGSAQKVEKPTQKVEGAHKPNSSQKLAWLSRLGQTSR